MKEKTPEENAFYAISNLASQGAGFDLDFICDNELITLSEVHDHKISIGRKFIMIPKNEKYKPYSFEIYGVSSANWRVIQPFGWINDVIKVHNRLIKEMTEFKLIKRKGILPI